MYHQEVHNTESNKILVAKQKTKDKLPIMQHNENDAEWTHLIPASLWVALL